MPDMEIRPYEGFGPIDFDATPDEVEQAVGVPDTTVPYDEDLRRLQTFYDDLGVKVVFDKDFRCYMVECWTPPCVPTYSGILLAGTIDDVFERLVDRGYALRQGTDVGNRHTTYCEALGVSFWRENIESPDIDATAAFRRGWEGIGL